MKKWSLVVLVAFFSSAIIATMAQAAGPRVVYSVKILSPAGGEQWQAGTSQEIKWEISPAFATVKVYYQNQADGWLKTIVDNYPAGKDGYQWFIPKDFTPGKYAIWVAATFGISTSYVKSQLFSVVAPPPVWAQVPCLVSEVRVLNVNDVQNDGYVGVQLKGVLYVQEGREVRYIYALAPFFFGSQLSGLELYGGRVITALLLTISVPEGTTDACAVDPESIGSTFYIVGIAAIDLSFESYLSGGVEEGYGKSSGTESSPWKMLLPKK